MALIKAYCYRSGELQFGTKVPEGAIEICQGKELVKNAKVRARHAYDNKTLLVPGIPEAENDTEAFLALEKFKEFIIRK